MNYPQLRNRFPQRQSAPGAEIVKIEIHTQPYLTFQDALCAAVAFAMARRTHGSFIVNIDDTDPDPLEADNHAIIFNQLAWLDLIPDESRDLGQYGPYLWSKRRDIYRDFAQDLVESGLAYHCFAPANTPPGEVSASHQDCDCLGEDDELSRLLAGEKSLICLQVPKSTDATNAHLKDFPLLTADGMPMPCFAHVVDNHLMQVTTHVRRHDALDLVPYELLIFQALKWSVPTMIHLPAIHDTQLSGFFNEVCLSGWLTECYSPEALLNYLTQLIWSHPANLTVYPFADFIDYFEHGQAMPDAQIVDYKLLDFIQERYTYA